jgi:hypothetical protein
MLKKLVTNADLTAFPAMCLELTNAILIPVRLVTHGIKLVDQRRANSAIQIVKSATLMDQTIVIQANANQMHISPVAEINALHVLPLVLPAVQLDACHAQRDL